MDYKVIGKNDIYNPQNCIFENRGITDIEAYKNLTDDCIIPYSKLSNINEAVQLFLKYMNDISRIAIIVDCDCDGFTSAATIYDYIRKVSPDTEIKYITHTGKQHGLSKDIKFPFEPDIKGDEENDSIPQYKNTLLIIPDGGTNDVEQCSLLSEMGIEILILDHHIQDINNPYAVIVNNQISPEYTNKDFSGVGIVYKFLQAVDDELWESYADNYLDLVALGNISDVMDIRSFETKRFIEKGLSSIHNKCFKALLKAQEYSIGIHINIKSIAFYISPLINAMCRVGDSDEKDLLFRAFIETDEIFKYKKRGEKEETIENIYDRAARLCKNAKARQDKAVQKVLPDLKKSIENKVLNNNPVMFVKLDKDVSNTFTGLIASKLSDYYKKPCLLLRKTKENVYRGSARSCDNCPIENLKSAMINVGNFEFCQGHENAFGFMIKPENVRNTIVLCNKEFESIDFDKFNVDFKIDFENLDVRFIREIDSMQDYFGMGLKEPIIAVTNIILERNQSILLGKEKTTWKFISEENNIAFIKLKNNENDKVIKWLNSNNSSEMMIDAICKVGFNNFNGIVTPQVTIDKYEVI